MRVNELLAHLESVHARGPGKWSARCPAHADRSPSLSMREGARAILLKCWAGCSLQDITSALGLRTADLFYDTSQPSTPERRHAAQQRAAAKAARQTAYEQHGWKLDLLREAEALIGAARNITIESWSDERLHRELLRLGTAYQLLESETVYERL